MNAQLAASDPVFSLMAEEARKLRDEQKKRWWYVYNYSGFIDGQTTSSFDIIIDQGSDFFCQFISMSAYSYASPPVHTLFPLPNPSVGADTYAGRGLSIRITDTRAGRELTSGFIPVELIACPGWDNSMDRPFPFRYMFYRNTKITFDIRNHDNAARMRPASNSVNPGSGQQFEIALNGYKMAGEGPQ